MAVVATPIVGVVKLVDQNLIVQPKWDGRKWAQYVPNNYKGHLPEIFNIRAPNNQIVPVTICTNRKLETLRDETKWVLCTDGADEVAGPDNPANTDPLNTVAYRVAEVYAKCLISDPVKGDIEEIRPVGIFDYSKFGFIKIGKIWVDEGRPSDIEKAKKRIENQNNTDSCILL